MVPDVLAVTDLAGTERAALVGRVDAAAGRGAPSRGEPRGLRDEHRLRTGFPHRFREPDHPRQVIGLTLQLLLGGTS